MKVRICAFKHSLVPGNIFFKAASVFTEAMQSLSDVWVMVCVTPLWVCVPGLPKMTLCSVICFSIIKFPIPADSDAAQRLYESRWRDSPVLPACESDCAIWLFKQFLQVIHSSHIQINPTSTGTSARSRWPRPHWVRPSRGEAVSAWSPRNSLSQRGGPLLLFHLRHTGELKAATLLVPPI